jgi:hypothetical protein
MIAGEPPMSAGEQPMRTARRSPVALVLVLALASLAAIALSATAAHAAPLADDGNAQWRLEQPLPPPLSSGVQPGVPIGLGRIGDIEFWAPNRGVLITAGNGSTIPSGVWAYNGVQWHELSTVCGATDGRIAWAGPEEFWTISDGRPGQAANPANGAPAPLEDDTLCHFAAPCPECQLQVVGSYASLAFQASSYQPMHAAGCLGPSDCWFGGGLLPQPQIGAFQLHFNGHTVSAEPSPQGHVVQDMRLFGGRLYESVRLAPEDRVTDPEPSPVALRRINPVGVQPTFVALSPGVPEYLHKEFPTALDYLRLSADAEGLWGAAGPTFEDPEKSQEGEARVVRYAGGAWSQVLGPSEPAHAAPGERADPFGEDVVDSIAAEPGGAGAWIALDTRSDAASPSPTVPALVARIAADGTVSDELQLPIAGEAGGATGPKGAAEHLACPAPHDCWLATSQGWLFHLSEKDASPPPDTDAAFAGLVTFRPPDEGVPQVVPDAPPVDNSGLNEEVPGITVEKGNSTPEQPAMVRVALLSDVHTKIRDRTTLELRFHLAVKARVRLVAKRHRSIVARTAMSTLAAGSHRLLLRLDAHRWPTKLDLETHALAPLPIASTRGAGNDTVSTESLAFPNALGLPGSDALGLPGLDALL